MILPIADRSWVINAVESGMISETVRADQVDDQVFLLRDRFGFPIVMTQPQGINGADLLPLSLIGCSAWGVPAILRRQRQHIERFDVIAERARDPDPPWRFRSIRTTYRCAGSNLRESAIRRAIELTETTYCSIYATLRDAVRISSTFEMSDASNMSR